VTEGKAYLLGRIALSCSSVYGATDPWILASIYKAASAGDSSTCSETSIVDISRDLCDA
jgi:hypothetical protein